MIKEYDKEADFIGPSVCTVCFKGHFWVNCNLTLSEMTKRKDNDYVIEKPAILSLSLYCKVIENIFLIDLVNKIRLKLVDTIVNTVIVELFPYPGWHHIECSICIVRSSQSLVFIFGSYKA